MAVGWKDGTAKVGPFQRIAQPPRVSQPPRHHPSTRPGSWCEGEVLCRHLITWHQRCLHQSEEAALNAELGTANGTQSGTEPGPTQHRCQILPIQATRPVPKPTTPTALHPDTTPLSCASPTQSHTNTAKVRRRDNSHKHCPHLLNKLAQTLAKPPKQTHTDTAHTS